MTHSVSCLQLLISIEWVCACLYAYMWKSEAAIRRLHLTLSTLSFETESFIEPGAYGIAWAVVLGLHFGDRDPKLDLCT